MRPSTALAVLAIVALALAKGWVVPIKTREQFEALINSDKVVIVHFLATWNGPCQTISPVFEVRFDVLPAALRSITAALATETFRTVQRRRVPRG